MTPAVPDGFAGNSDDTFRFSRELVEHDTDEWMHEHDNSHTSRYQQVVREPLRALQEVVVPAVIELISEFEVRVNSGKVMAAIPKD